MMLRSANNGPKIAYVFMLLNYHDLFACIWDIIFSKVILCFSGEFHAISGGLNHNVS